MLVGSNGMLAQDVAILAPSDIRLALFDIPMIDITDPASVQAVVGRTKPSLVLNCAAYTAVDRAETEREQAYAVNADGPRHLALACRAAGVPLVHISTDFVFDGDGSRLLDESEAINPSGVYAASKRAGELAIEQSGCEWLTVRTSWLYAVHGKNFPNTMLRLAAEREELTVVNDQRGCPTFARDLAAALWRLIAVGARGYVHFCNAGVCSWCEFAQAIVSEAAAIGLLKRAPRVVPISSQTFNSPAPRPAYSAMATARYAALTNVQPRPWQTALTEYLTIKAGTRAS